MILRDNADDYLERAKYSIAWLQAWTILGDIDCPPSLEVFSHGWEAAAHDTKHLTPQHYAHAVVAKYKRTDADREQGQPWWRWSEDEGRLRPT